MKNHSLSTHFSAHASNLRTTDSLQTYVRGLRGAFPFRHVTYYCSSFPGRLGKAETVTSYPEAWRTHYLAEHYERTDPVLRRGRNSFLPVDWSRIEDLSPGERRFLEASYDFGLGRHGTTVAVRGPHRETAFVSVNAGTPPSSWWPDMHLGIADLTYFGFLLHQHISQLVGAGRRAPAAAPLLAPRERDVLTWAARGKTAWETAQILSISETTVVSYLRSGTAKLGAATKPQAVARAICENLVTL